MLEEAEEERLPRPGEYNYTELTDNSKYRDREEDNCEDDKDDDNEAEDWKRGSTI